MSSILKPRHFPVRGAPERGSLPVPGVWWIEGANSRLIVAFRPPLLTRKPWLRFAQNARFLPLSAFGWCKFACKMRTICTTKKSDVLCFQPLLSFVPPIYHTC